MNAWAELHDDYRTLDGDRVMVLGPSKQDDFPFDPTPAAAQTENLAVTGPQEPVCSVCQRVPATMSAYYAELGTTARLLPWCDSCATVTLPLVVAAGFIVTLLPREPLPSYAEVRRQLDDAERPDAYLRRMEGGGPRPRRGRVGYGG